MHGYRLTRKRQLNSRQLDRIGDCRRLCGGRQLPFATTLVARHGQVAFLDCRGMADLAADRPARPDDLVRLYSMTKPVTAVAALMLYEAGVLQWMTLSPNTSRPSPTLA